MIESDMERDNENSEEMDLWRELVEAHKAFLAKRLEFWSKVDPKTKVLRSALKQPEDRALALQLLRDIDQGDKKILLYDLLELASFSHGLTKQAQEVILSLPHGWLLANIEETAEPILKRDDYEEYRAMLTLYSKIDKELAQRLVQRALKSNDPDIVEAGEDFSQADK